jgi:HK97 gp10 family phage protein
MRVDVQVKGLEELKRELARLDAAVATRLARNASMAMARVVAKHARANAPVLTGALKRSIKARKDPERRQAGRVVAYANAKAWQSHLVEYGTSRAPAPPARQPGRRASRVSTSRISTSSSPRDTRSSAIRTARLGSVVRSHRRSASTPTA